MLGIDVPTFYKEFLPISGQIEITNNLESSFELFWMVVSTENLLILYRMLCNFHSLNLILDY